MLSKTTNPPKTHYRQTLWEAGAALAFPRAMWRLPQQKDKHFLVSFSEKPETTKIDFDELEAGFVVSPFLNDEMENTLFLKADLCYVFNEVFNEVSNEVSNEKEDFEEIISLSSANSNFESWQRILEEYSSKSPSKLRINSTSISTESNACHQDFIASVEKAIETIKSGAMQKVVLSKKKEILLPDNFEVVATFDKLCEAYPNAFVSAVALPHLGVIWVGASPETLVSQNENAIFRTMALAGTQSAFDKNGNKIKASEALWRQKEIEEQSLVCRYIIGCFKRIRLREYLEEGPKTVVAGNLMHLQTDFTVDTNAVNFPQLSTVMLELLHPTSAVCGMPKQVATQFILENEGYDREFYSGFLGPVNIRQASHIFVNLRTMKLQNNTATLYAGCGITADSDPEKEWQETEIKCETLFSVINQ